MHLEISKKLSIPDWKVKNTIELLSSDNTVHFIARYRKEQTGNLDENHIRDIIELKSSIEKLNKAKQSAIKNIDEQGKLTPGLKSQIESATTLLEVEDIYAPYKRAKKTKADIAIEKGFLPLAEQMKRHGSFSIPNSLFQFSKEEIESGVQDILNQEIADNVLLKKNARSYFSRNAIVESKYTKANHEQKDKFKIYDKFSSVISKLKSHQILALNRGEDLKILSVKLAKDESFFINSLAKFISLDYTYLKEGCKKVFNSVENELRKELTLSAVKTAVVVFQDNLKQLLMLKPHYGLSILAIDPGFRTGCKICTIESDGTASNFSKIFLDNESKAVSTLQPLIKDRTIVIGNGTASKECCELLAKNFENDVIVVNESGASVYSTSAVGGEEFPNLDATDRGTISIGRRYIDCLSELVKVPVISIGVGLYQHDMPKKELEEKLKVAVEDVVNLVGVNLNSASTYLLSYISGLNKTSAKKIFNNKPYKSRAQLSKVLSPKIYEQAIGFLRVPNSSESLDNTSIHPEQYAVAKEVISKKNFTVVNESFPDLTQSMFDEIMAAHNLAGKELRNLEGNKSKQKHLNIEDLKIDDIVDGIVRNVAPFGAFVDIGVKNDGLVHISQLANRFVKDPNEVVSVGQEVKVKIIGIEKESGKIQLSMKEI